MPEQSQSFTREAIASLCAQAVHPDEVVSNTAVRRLFAEVVEVLNDSFLPSRAALYDKIFTQVINHCRHLPEGKGLDELLKRFDITDERTMLARKKKIQAVAVFSPTVLKKVRKICVLSRVTIGADVAVTGVVLRKLMTVFPGVSITLIGPNKLAEVFGGHPDIRIKDVPYARRGGLLGRLYAWVDLVSIIDAEKQDLEPEEFLVIDPDSRLTQLGLLPVVPEDRGYYFFPSRTYTNGQASSMGALTACWLEDIFGGGNKKIYPGIFINQDVLALGKTCAQKLSLSGQRPVVSINFGVGGNENKRVSSVFEECLVAAIIQLGAAVILDKGFGSEVALTDAMLARLKSKGLAVLEVDPGNIQELSRQKSLTYDVLTWEGGIGVFSAMIAASDVYIGYDSGFQHIAAAQGIAVIDVLIGAASPLFARRWTPYGRNNVLVIRGSRGRRAQPYSEAILTQITAYLGRKLLAKNNKSNS